MINADINTIAFADPDEQPWISSPSGLVTRKRFYHEGTPEGGKVSSLVRYAPGAEFPEHGHPGGEEILVLEGTFSDHSIDCAAFGYLLNPEGFSHAPWSKQGCLIFVRLQQYPGDQHIAASCADIDETDCEFGPSRLLHSEGLRRTMLVIPTPEIVHEGSWPGGVEGLVLSGMLSIGNRTLRRHQWFRSPPGATLSFSTRGCELYLQENALLNFEP